MVEERQCLTPYVRGDGHFKVKAVGSTKHTWNPSGKLSPRGLFLWAPEWMCSGRRMWSHCRACSRPGTYQVLKYGSIGLSLETPISMSEPALHLDGQVHLGQGRLQLISFQGPAMSPTVSETDPAWQRRQRRVLVSYLLNEWRFLRPIFYEGQATSHSYYTFYHSVGKLTRNISWSVA